LKVETSHKHNPLNEGRFLLAKHRVFLGRDGILGVGQEGEKTAKRMGKQGTSKN